MRQNELDFIQNKNLTCMLGNEKVKWLTCRPGVPVVCEHGRAGSQGGWTSVCTGYACVPFWPVQLHWQLFGLLFSPLDTEL